MESRIENLNKALENISAKEEYLQSVSVELEGFQEKIDIFKTNLKSFNDRVDNLENSFSRKNERALNDIEQRVLSNFEAEIQNAFSELNTHRKALEDFYSEIDVRLNEERKRLSESLLNINEKKEEIHSSFDAKINDFSTKVSQDLNHLYEEHQNRLTSFEKAFRENESRIVNIIRDEGTKKIQDINVCFDSSWNDTKVKLQHYENNIVESINKHYENGKIDVEKILQELRTVEIRVSKSMLELSDLDSKVQQKSDSFELCLEESIKNKIDKFYDGLHEIESDIESMQTTIFSSLKNKYEKFDFVIMSELKKLGLRIGEKVELKWKELSEMENKVSELKEAMFSVENDVKETVSKLNEMSQDLKDNLYQRIDTVSADVNEKIKDMSLSYEDKRKTLINAMKNSLDSLDSDSREKVFNLRNQIQEIYSAVKSRLTTAENEIQRKTDTINRKFDQKIELIDEQIRQREDRANTLIMEKMLGYFKDADEKSKEFASNLQEYYEDIFKLKNDFRKKCEGLTSWFAEKVKVFAGENDIVGRKYREELKMLEADSLNLRDKIQAENNQYIQSLNNQFKQIEDKLPIINEKIRLNSENISRITENSIADMQKTVSS
jgi:predicted  nucleic acid-binding Zn-ribbon protein